MSNDYLSEIRDVNFSYLTTAQQMIRHDRAEAIVLLGISAEIADLLSGMSTPQILKMASCNIMLLRFRFNDTEILSSLLRDKTGAASASVKTTAAAAQAPETIV